MHFFFGIGYRRRGERLNFHRKPKISRAGSTVTIVMDRAYPTREKLKRAFLAVWLVFWAFFEYKVGRSLLFDHSPAKVQNLPMWLWFFYWTAGGVYFLVSFPGILLFEPETLALSCQEITVTTGTATRHWRWSEISFLELSESRNDGYSIRLAAGGKQESLFAPSNPHSTKVVFQEIRAFLSANDLKNIVTLYLPER